MEAVEIETSQDETQELKPVETVLYKIFKGKTILEAFRNPRLEILLERLGQLHIPYSIDQGPNMAIPSSGRYVHPGHIGLYVPKDILSEVMLEYHRTSKLVRQYHKAVLEYDKIIKLRKTEINSVQNP